jgi:hypothetical protein
MEHERLSFYLNGTDLGTPFGEGLKNHVLYPAVSLFNCGDEVTISGGNKRKFSHLFYSHYIIIQLFKQIFFFDLGLFTRLNE